MHQVAAVEGTAEDAVRYPGHQPLPSAPRVVPDRPYPVGYRFEVTNDMPLAALLQPALLLEHRDLVPELSQFHQYRVLASPGVRMQIQDAHQVGTPNRSTHIASTNKGHNRVLCEARPDTCSST